ncbi:hypothetical protein [Pseudoclavibacter helvolus]|uniref:hypothetical protein n=1 Tax=Pseudoclavibacter helvolus TaxID=255205 RepID=UPI00366CEF4C
MPTKFSIPWAAQVLLPAAARRLAKLRKERWRIAEIPSRNSPQASIWGSEIDAWASSSVTEVVEHVTPSDNFSDVLKRAVDRATALPGPVTPLTHRARLVMAPGVYGQGIAFDYAWKSNIAIELIAPGRDAIVEPTEDVGALEHAGISCLIVGITFRKTSGNAWVVHGSGRAGLAREMIMHDCRIEALNGAHAFAHENAAAHTLYMSEVVVEGRIYQHTIRTSVAEPTLAIWDACEADLCDFGDESAHSDDLLVVRGGSSSSDTFTISFQRTGSPWRPRLSAGIDPTSGIKKTNSRRVEFEEPAVDAYPVLDRNERMLLA